MKYPKHIFTTLAILFLFQSNLFATEYATFTSFYVESSSVGWIIATVLAVAAGAAIFFTGGTASPIVLGIGTWIGETAGLSGIAATNYGLALLGGGSIASGGLGIAGGVAVLTATLSFSTDVIMDYTLSNVVSSYSYSNFVKDSKKMPTLPIPQNENGSSAYENIVINLKKNINNKIPLSANSNQIILKDTSSMFTPSSNDAEELTKENTLKSYLSLVTNDYENAKLYANKAITEARKLQIKRTMPAFIYATSSLYDKTFNFDMINNNYFRYSILAEPDNELIPLMFAIYLDRIMYRMNDDTSLNYKTINAIRDIAFEIKDDDIQEQSLVVVMMRYLIKLKIEQQKIIALATTSNKTIKNNKKTLEVVNNSFIEYDNLLKSLSKILAYKPMEEFMKEDTKLEKIFVLDAKYEESKTYLREIIQELKEYQIEAKKAKRKAEEKKWWKFWK